jgi:protein TonB
MAQYRGTADRPDKAKAIAAVVAVHAALAALILTGLNVRSMAHVVERLKTFDIRLPPPPPPPPPPPQKRADRARDKAGAAGKKAVPTPVVAPKPIIVIPAKPPVAAAPVAGAGSASNAGAATSGSGTGAGGAGNGLGGGGGGTGAHWIRGALYDNDNRGGRFVGVVQVRFTILPSGRISQCRAIRPSGDDALDSTTCRLLEQRLEFSPARDASGRPIATQMEHSYTWGVRRRPF